MPAPGIAEPLDVIEDIGPSIVAGRVDLAMYTPHLQRSEEAFHRGDVPTADAVAHASSDAFGSQQALEVLAGVLGELNPSSQHSE